MKKRYRSESATADASSWPLYSCLDLLLRETRPVSTLPLPPPATVAAVAATPSHQSPHPSNNQPLMLLEPSLAVSQAPHHQAPPPGAFLFLWTTSLRGHPNAGLWRFLATWDLSLTSSSPGAQGLQRLLSMHLSGSFIGRRLAKRSVF